MLEVQIVAALLRRGSDLLIVLQGGRDEEPHWSVPAGRVEAGEFATEALARELREETGLALLEPGALAFVAQVDDRPAGWFGTVWTWEVGAWEGDLAPSDPDGLIHEVAWQPLRAAVDHLAGIAWHALTVRYLRGELEPGGLWVRRVHAGGRVEEAGPFGSRR